MSAANKNNRRSSVMRSSSGTVLRDEVDIMARGATMVQYDTPRTNRSVRFNDSGTSGSRRGSLADTKGKRASMSERMLGTISGIMRTSTNLLKDEPRFRSQRELEIERTKTALQLLEDADDSTARHTIAGFNLHRLYQWLCIPYNDRWFPMPSKKTLRKTLNRLDYNSYNPFDVFEDFYKPFWSQLGLLLSIGSTVLIFMYFTFLMSNLSDENALQHDSYWATNHTVVDNLPEQTGFRFVPAGESFGFYDPSYFQLVWTMCTVLAPTSGAYTLSRSDRAFTATSTPNDTTSIQRTCVDTNVVPCTINGRPDTWCPNGTIPLRGVATFEVFRYAFFTARYCDNATDAVTCQPLDEIMTKMDGGSVEFSQFVESTDPNRILRFSGGTRSHPREIKWNLFSTALAPEVIMRFHNVTLFFPDLTNEDSNKRVSFVEYASHSTLLTAFDAAAGVVFRAIFQLTPDRSESVFITDNYLDVASRTGGIFAFCWVGLLVFRQLVVYPAFASFRRMKVDEDTAKTIVRKKEEELAFYKEKLLHMKAQQKLRITLKDLSQYLNTKRDREIVTFKHALFTALYFKQHDEQAMDDWDNPTERREQANDTGGLQRLEELQDLVRIDEVQRTGDPDIATIVNVLGIQEIERQIKIIANFIQHL